MNGGCNIKLLMIIYHSSQQHPTCKIIFDELKTIWASHQRFGDGWVFISCLFGSGIDMKEKFKVDKEINYFST